MITAADLRNYTVKDLVAMARKRKVLGWHEMRKDELVQALLKEARKTDATDPPTANRPKPCLPPGPRTTATMATMVTTVIAARPRRQPKKPTP